MRIYNKLVRDKIPDRIHSDGFEVSVRVLDDPEFGTALLKKLKEEVQEVLKAKSREQLITELADVEEVIRAIARNAKISLSTIGRVRRQRAEERGGFTDRVFLAHTSEPPRRGKRGRQKKK